VGGRLVTDLRAALWVLYEWLLALVDATLQIVGGVMCGDVK
jgi:hypothetical protein